MTTRILSLESYSPFREIVLRKIGKYSETLVKRFYVEEGIGGHWGSQ
jgi:hypothetical protein